MVRMYREEFYIGLLQGMPDPYDNDTYFHGFRDKAMDLFGWIGKQGSVVLPFKVRHSPSHEWLPFQRKIGPKGQDGYRGDPEQFPYIVSAGLFESAPTTGDTEINEGSALNQIRFQHDAHVVLEDEPLAWLRQIKWDDLAYDYTN